MKLEKIRYSALQLSLLSILLKSKKELTLEELEKQVYKNCGKRRPSNSRQSLAALIRSTSNKVGYIKAEIKRTTPLGRGNVAAYILDDTQGHVKTTVDKALA